MLDDEAVRQRTETTIKLSNVARESVSQTSEYLTAVWNNFAKEGDNLERYADVMTALGAATASSSQEIAEGLNQFASVGDTIGLSFDYAASALATITSQTRQSASVVGTALKTLFSRMEGLKLGQTLEDGTDLTKYSAGLATIGVNIKDENGELKKMDSIIDEIGNKWSSLARDQQIALAQTVAGKQRLMLA